MLIFVSFYLFSKPSLSFCYTRCVTYSFSLTFIKTSQEAQIFIYNFSSFTMKLRNSFLTRIFLGRVTVSTHSLPFASSYIEINLLERCFTTAKSPFLKPLWTFTFLKCFIKCKCTSYLQMCWNTLFFLRNVLVFPCYNEIFWNP